MKKNLIVLIAFWSIAQLFISCNGNKIIYPDSYNGLWQQEGYGRIVELEDSLIHVYDICKTNCAVSFSEEILDFGRIIEVSNDLLIIKHGIDRWRFKKINQLPKLCEGDIKGRKNDPIFNFEVFWNTLNEHYSSFDLKGVNWEKVYIEQRSKLNNHTSDLELFLIFEEMIALLNDGHVEMEIPESIASEYIALQEKKRGKYNFWHELDVGGKIAQMYVDSLKSKSKGMTRWGMINQHIGYIQINSMMVQADYSISEDLELKSFIEQYWGKVETRKDEEHREDEVAGMHQTMNTVLTDLSEATSIILDIRFNGGGKDGVAMAIIDHFSASEKTVANKKAKGFKYLC